MNENQDMNNSNNLNNAYNQSYNNQPVPTNNIQQPIDAYGTQQQAQMTSTTPNITEQPGQIVNPPVQPNYQEQPNRAMPTIIETPIVFEEENSIQPAVVADVIPTFDTSVLEELPDDLKPIGPEEPLINSMTKENQQEKDQHKRNIIFIAILFAVLIFAVVVIFPILLDV